MKPKSKAVTPTLKLAEYLFTRLRQLGVQSIYGVPGDYNLELLDYIEPSGLQWIGICNELNAGYAADGHSRISGLSALITTFGVGELSAINAIAGAYCEKVPIVHIVGSPSRTSQESRTQLHHTLNDGDFSVFAQMQSHVTAAQISLDDPRMAPSQIDSILLQCLMSSQPVYIEVPTDMVHVSVDAASLKFPLKISSTVDHERVEASVKSVADMIYASKKPMILVDGEIRAFLIVPEVNDFIKAIGWPTWTTAFGKGLVDETLENVFGIYSGKYSNPAIREYAESSDFLIHFGPHLSSHNTYRFSAVPAATHRVVVESRSIYMDSTRVPDISALDFLRKLLDYIDFTRIPCPTMIPALIPSYAPDVGRVVELLHCPYAITHQYFWQRVSHMLLPGDIILGETGTSGYGTRSLRLPQYSRYFAPVTWLSIGHMLPAAFGASMAQREVSRRPTWQGPQRQRTILFIGDGSIQMTIQALSEIITHKLNVIVFVINNAGYTVERYIHGKAQKYNDIASWRYTLAPELFGGNGAGEHRYRTAQAKTVEDVEILLKDEDFVLGNGLRVVEVMMGQMDAPQHMIDVMEDRKIKLQK